MLLTRITNIFMLTTSPTDLSTAQPHSAGWSESVWTALNSAVYNPLWTTWAYRRALMLPKQGSIVGFRSALYDLVGNKILPRGAAAGKWLIPGNAAFTTDLPQVSLEVSSTAAGASNTSRMTLRGIPDSMMVGGEYQPTPTFKASFTIMANALLGNNFGFVGRDLSQPSSRVNLAAAGVVTLDANIGGVAGTSYLRFHRVNDNDDKPVKGTYRITNIAGNVYTLQIGRAHV